MLLRHAFGVFGVCAVHPEAVPNGRVLIAFGVGVFVEAPINRADLFISELNRHGLPPVLIEH